MLLSKKSVGMIRKALDRHICKEQELFLRFKSGYRYEAVHYLELYVSVSKGKVKCAEKGGNYLFYYPITDLSYDMYRSWGDSETMLRNFDYDVITFCFIALNELGLATDEYALSRFMSANVLYKNKIRELYVDKFGASAVDEFMDKCSRETDKFLDNMKVTTGEIAVRNLIQSEIMSKYGVTNSLPILEISKNLILYVVGPDGSRVTRTRLEDCTVENLLPTIIKDDISFISREFKKNLGYVRIGDCYYSRIRDKR